MVGQWLIIFFRNVSFQIRNWMDCSLDRNNKVTQFDSFFKNSGKIGIPQLLVQIFGLLFSLSGLDIIPILKLKLGDWISTNTPFNKFPLGFNIGLFWINLFLVDQKVSVLLKKDRFTHYIYIKNYCWSMTQALQSSSQSF